jgi:hypothetical protein
MRSSFCAKLNGYRLPLWSSNPMTTGSGTLSRMPISSWSTM